MASRPASARDGDEPAADTILTRSAPGDDRAKRLEDLVAALASTNAQLQRALDSRVVVEQAKGVLAERFALDMADAFDLLRRSARNNRMRLHDLAARVVASRETPAEIESGR